MVNPEHNYMTEPGLSKTTPEGAGWDRPPQSLRVTTVTGAVISCGILCSRY
jgi:hypothetical protein